MPDSGYSMKHRQNDFSFFNYFRLLLTNGKTNIPTFKSITWVGGGLKIIIK